MKHRSGPRLDAAPAPATPTTLPADDILRGVPAITDFLEELLGEKIPRGTVYEWIESGKIPAAKWGPKLLIASRQGICAAFAVLLGGPKCARVRPGETRGDRIAASRALLRTADATLDAGLAGRRVKTATFEMAVELSLRSLHAIREQGLDKTKELARFCNAVTKPPRGSC